MAVRVIREVNRSEGRLPTSGSSILAGQPLMINPSDGTFKPYDGTSGAVPYGIASDTTTFFPLAAASGLTAGQGYDYTNFARGGLVGSFTNGSELVLFNDGRGAPYNTSDTFAINHGVTTDSSGVVRAVGNVAVSATSPLIGYVVSFDVATNPTQLQIKFII